ADAPDPELRAAVAAALLGRPDGSARARALLASVLDASEPPPVRVLLVAGAAAFAEGDADAARKAYRRALDAGPAPAERAEAAAGLARAARAADDGSGAAAAP